MTDKEILDEVYRRLNESDDPQGFFNNWRRNQINFIEEEWQKRDEKELVDQYNRNRRPEDWIMDVSEMERHRGLEIGPDGTVNNLK